MNGIFEQFRGILHEGEIDKRVQYLLEGLFATRKAKFQGYPTVLTELDLVPEEDKLTWEISLLDEIDPELHLDMFKADPNFLEGEEKYENLKKNMLGEDSDSDSESEDEESELEDEKPIEINDETDTSLVDLRRTIYLTIMSGLNSDDAGHKLLNIKMEPELCIMLIECCSQERTYNRYYGLLGHKFCMINKVYRQNFEKCFVQQYSMVHRLDTNKLCNIACLFAELLSNDALPWHVLSCIRLTEEDTTCSARIFIKFLFQALSEHIGLRLLNEKMIADEAVQESIFPKDRPENMRFAINFLTAIGLCGITEDLRRCLKNMSLAMHRRLNAM